MKGHESLSMLTRREFLVAAGVTVTPVPRLRAATSYDLLIKGGRLMDPAQRLDRIGDLAIRSGRIVAIGPRVAASGDADVIDAAGKLVIPGLVDIHAHVNLPEMPPAHCLSTGVTSVVDAGSAGADNIEDLVATARKAPNRVRILLNIARRGVAPEGELLDFRNADVEAARRAVQQHREWIIGMKVRVSRTVAGPNDLEAIRRAQQIVGPLGLPLMVHIGDSVSPLPDVLRLLKPRDIVTHVYAPPPHGIFDPSGRVLPAVRDARRRGILFDIGNGRNAHITWDTAESGMRQQFLPDTISSDLTAPGLTDRAFDLPTVLSKFLMLGMTVNQVVACATVHAAHAHRALSTLGTLRVGASADVAVFDLRDGDFEFVDNVNAKRIGHRKLVPSAVVMAGKKFEVRGGTTL